MSTQSKTIYGGLKALGRELAREEWRDARYTVIVDENTFTHCLPTLIGTVEPLQEAAFIEVPTGEECKCLDVASQVWQTLIDEGADRNAVLVNLGGGAVCDLGGFVAAGYKRGIRHINIPTTLLAMVDAAIGGKTAVNLGGVKNSIGHFYPSAITVIEPGFLGTLPQEELLNGKMEMAKTALVADPVLYDSLIHADDISRRQIVGTARIKVRVAKADPYDRSIRHILNFGHTFGHAIEVHSNLPHGIATGIGMKAAMYLSVNKLNLDRQVYDTYSAWLEKNVALPHYTLHDTEQMLPLMHNDKKNACGETRCVLLQTPGAAVIDVPVSDNELRDTLLRL